MENHNWPMQNVRDSGCSAMDKSNVSTFLGWVLCVNLPWMGPVYHPPLDRSYVSISHYPQLKELLRGLSEESCEMLTFGYDMAVAHSSSCGCLQKTTQDEPVKIPAYLPFSPQGFICLDGATGICSCWGRVSHSPLRTLLLIGYSCSSRQT